MVASARMPASVATLRNCVLRPHKSFADRFLRQSAPGDAARLPKGAKGRARPRRLVVDELEDRRMMSATSPVETTYKDLVLVDVVGRNLFYNNSSFDGNN